MYLHNLTPQHLRCTIGACPAVFQQQDNSLVIIGKKADTTLSHHLKDQIGSDEDVIVISPDLLERIKKIA